jgi:hypothetical protein
MCLGLPHPDPLDRGTDPRIRTKMSRIHNAGSRDIGTSVVRS